MTREEFRELIHWPWIICAFSVVNVSAMIPQLWSMCTTRVTEGFSISMVWIYLSVQIAFMVHGFLYRDKFLSWCMLASAIVSIATIVSFYVIHSMT